MSRAYHVSREEGRSLSDGEERPYASMFFQRFVSVLEQRKIHCKPNITAPQGLAQFFGAHYVDFPFRNHRRKFVPDPLEAGANATSPKGQTSSARERVWLAATLAIQLGPFQLLSLSKARTNRPSRQGKLDDSAKLCESNF